jgi:hypothetical protein
LLELISNVFVIPLLTLKTPDTFSPSLSRILPVAGITCDRLISLVADIPLDPLNTLVAVKPCEESNLSLSLSSALAATLTVLGIFPVELTLSVILNSVVSENDPVIQNPPVGHSTWQKVHSNSLTTHTEVSRFAVTPVIAPARVCKKQFPVPRFSVPTPETAAPAELVSGWKQQYSIDTLAEPLIWIYTADAL